MSPSDPEIPPKAGKRVRKRRPARSRGITETTLTLLDQLLLRPRSMSLNGEKMQLATIKVILLQLLQKDMAGSRRARNVLLKYREFAGRTEGQKFEIRFAESETARATAELESGGENG
jgi:hypothetical protein